jgi:predicted alpha/beta-hydrolase family hydrolase
VVLFVHSAGGSRHDPTDTLIARALNQERIATVLVNLCTAAERELDADPDHRLDATILGPRAIALVDHLASYEPTAGLHGAFCASGSGAASALIAAAARPAWVHAVLCRAGRPDRAGEFVRLVRCPTLLLVGEADGAVREANERVEPEFPRTARVVHLPGVSVLREEPEATRLVVELAKDWFPLRLGDRARSGRGRPGTR